MHIDAISTPATIALGSLIFVFVTHLQNPTISGIGLGDRLRARIDPRRAFGATRQSPNLKTTLARHREPIVKSERF